MKFFSAKALFQNRFWIAVVSGILLAASFPGIGIAGFGWIAPGLMLAAALGNRIQQSFRIGYIAGLAHYLTSLHWLLLIPYRWHGLPLAPALGWIALSSYLALFPAAWVWFCIRIGNNDWPIGEWSWSRRTIWSFACAAGWVAMEMAVTRLLGGFPWNLLGASQHRMIPLIQIASVAGVYGVSFLVVWTSVSLLDAVAVTIRKPTGRSVWLPEMIFPMLAVAAAFAFGIHRIGHLPPPERSLKVTVVQPAVPQTLIWDESEDMNRFRDLLRVSEQALTNDTDLLIWPEAALPKMLRYDLEIQEPVLSLARQHRVWMIVGSDDGERDADDSGKAHYFNSSFLISPDGEIVERYNKRNLVIFGEYIPFARWLPFLKWFTPVDQGFTPGDKPMKFQIVHSPQSTVHSLADESTSMNTEVFVTSPLICFEDTFPQLAREAATGDLDFLVNITNDGWFGENAAQWQQAANACFRSVENNLPLVRCANSGLTCWIDEAGRYREVFHDSRGTIYGPGFETFRIPLAHQREETFYHRHGDWFGWTCAAFSAVMLASRAAQVRNRVAKNS